MGFFILCIGFVAFALMSAAFSEQRRSRRGERNQSYQLVAKRFGGTSVPGGWFARPRANFRYNESFVVVQPVSIDGTELVQASLSWPDRTLTCVVGRHDVEHRAAWSRRLATVELASDLMSRQYFVRASDEGAFRKLFTNGVQWQVNQLWHFHDCRSLLVSLDHGTITVQKHVTLCRFDEIEEFTRLVLELFDQMLLTRSVGIEFVGGDEVQALDDPQCRVCGDEIYGDLVFCRRCKTPHHHECWQYFGACSVYGCGERSFVIPQTPHPLPVRHDPVTIRKPR